MAWSLHTKPDMYTPGYYKTNYCRLSLRELIRFRGLLLLPITFILTRFKKPDGAVWMPGLWSDTNCANTDLSGRFWQATEPHRQIFVRLGFSECKHSMVKNHLNPLYRDNGGIIYLHSNRSHIGMLIYAKLHLSPPIDRDVEHMTIAFTAAFASGAASCTNTKDRYDPLPGREVTKVPSNDPAFIYARFLEKLKHCAQTPLDFPDRDSLQRWFDGNQIEIFESRVKRKLFIQMSDHEVEEARRRLLAVPPPLK